MLLAFSACKKDDTVSTVDSTTNATVITNAPNAFTFTLEARSCNYSEIHQVQINADTLAVVITIGQYSSGKGSIVLKDSDSTTIYQKDLAGTMAAAEIVKLVTMPKTLNLVLSNFTGKVSIVVSGR